MVFFALLRNQHYFPNILSRFDVAMCVGDLVKRKSAVDMGLNPPFVHAAHDLSRPGSDLFPFAPHVTQIHAKDTFVAVH